MTLPGSSSNERDSPLMPSQAPVIISSDSPFARDVFVKRHPALIERLAEAWPYGPEQRGALAALAEENVDGVLRPLPDEAVDAEVWRSWGSGCYGRPWTEVPFLWAESFFYRRLLEAVGYYQPGPWRGVDLFTPFKRAELAGEAVAAEITALDDVAGLPEEEQGQALLLSSLWGNRADLALQVTAGRGGEAAHDCHRGGDHQCTRAGDHEHHQRLVDPVMPDAAEQQRRNYRYGQRDGEHDRRVNAGELVDEALRRSLGALGFLDGMDDASERGVTGCGRHAVVE